MENALNIPLNQIRAKMATLSREKEIYVYCGVGQRAYYATQALRSNGINAFNVSSGIKSYDSWIQYGRLSSTQRRRKAAPNPKPPFKI